MRCAVIMAGGAGVRLWPLSRQGRPKQLLRLFNGKSLLRQSYERVAAVLDPGAISVITTENHIPAVAKEIPELSPENLFGEPVGRDTANAVALSAAIWKERDPDAVLGVFTADHIITPIDRFRSAVDLAYRAAEEHSNFLITLGIRPIRPDTQYGYIHRGAQLADGVYEVSRFIEKPSLAHTTEYVACGDYYWNSGMFAWKAPTILKEIGQRLPQTLAAVRAIAPAWGTRAGAEKLRGSYPGLLRISIDFAVMEHAKKLLVVPMDCQWVDVGSWPAFESVVSADKEGNVTVGGDVCHLASRGNVVVSEDKHLIATIGVDDLVIVHAGDATLICKKRDAQSIKELVGKVNDNFGSRYA
ncbi:MAG: mannose-1-phosphate guanylyltransferase [Phycisphaerae bacterium]